MAAAADALAAGVAAGAGRGRGVVAGMLAAAMALASINLIALPGLFAVLPPWLAIAALICTAGPAVEEASKYAAFRLLLRPRRHGWRGYWLLGLTFGTLEAMLKLAPLLMPEAPPGGGGGAAAPLQAAEASALARVAGALASLLLHTALGGAVAIVAVGKPARPWMGAVLAGALHMVFNTFTTLAVAILSRVAGEAGAQLAVSLAPLLAMLLLLATLGVALRTVPRGGADAATRSLPSGRHQPGSPSR